MICAASSPLSTSSQETYLSGLLLPSIIRCPVPYSRLPPHCAITFRDRITEGMPTSLLLTFMWYRASIAEMPLWRKVHQLWSSLPTLPVWGSLPSPHSTPQSLCHACYVGHFYNLSQEFRSMTFFWGPKMWYSEWGTNICVRGASHLKFTCSLRGKGSREGRGIGTNLVILRHPQPHIACSLFPLRIQFSDFDTYVSQC